MASVELLGDRRLLAGPVRAGAALLAAVCALAFLVLAVVYHGRRTAGGLDARLFAALPRAAADRPALDFLVGVAPLLAVGVVVGTTTLLLVARRWRDAAFTAAAPSVTMLVVEASKRVVDRTLDGMLALPSGHTAGITSVALAMAVLLIQRFRARVVLAAVLGWVGATLLGAAMALVMVDAHLHYPTDTVAGYCMAVATTLCIALGADRVFRRSACRG